MVEKLSEAAVNTLFGQIKGWGLNDKGEITRRFTFKDFVEAMGFVNQVAAIAEELGHHPDILINYNRVTLSATTHDAGGLTPLDFKLAERVNAIVKG